MRRDFSHNAIALTLGLALLAGCELRQDGEDADQAVLTEPTPSPTSEETAPPIASIIRDDASPAAPALEPPPEPVRLVIPFRGGGTELSERAERLLAGALEARAIDEDWPIILRGHTDSAGNDQANLRASRSRAEAVAAWLVEEGVDDERIEVIAIGEQNAIAPNALPDGSPNEEGRARNRRVELVISPPRREAGESEEESGEPPARVNQGA